MKSRSTAVQRVAMVLGAACIAVGGSGCTMLRAEGDAERLGKAERIRCERWDGRERGTLLNRAAAEEVQRVLAKVVVPLRAATPLSQGMPLGTLTLEGPDGNTNVRFFVKPRWVEVEDRYYQLTETELEAVRQVVEPNGPSSPGGGYDRIP